VSTDVAKLGDKVNGLSTDVVKLGDKVNGVSTDVAVIKNGLSLIMKDMKLKIDEQPANKSAMTEAEKKR